MVAELWDRRIDEIERAALLWGGWRLAGASVRDGRSPAPAVAAHASSGAEAPEERSVAGQRQRPQSSSASRRTASLAGFLLLSQSGERPDR
jgi:hypothetical protein